ncbi:MAG: Thiol:disulfide interchange protein TlpA [Candidatus Hydrogenedentes bacterium ADurb.Bin179]|nr:MAG: Thiol:disulfide interchange protein TlpA [Candidatus Hydrogenedentes bacterium ADurb.Bin179]
MKRILPVYGAILAILVAVALPVFWGILFFFGRGSAFSRSVSIGSIWYDTEILVVFTLVMAPAAIFGICCALRRVLKGEPSGCPGLSALWGFSTIQTTVFLALYLAFAAPWSAIMNMDWKEVFTEVTQGADEEYVPSDEGLEFPALPLAEQVSQDPYAWNLYDMDGKEVPMSLFRDKVVFLNLWATWCGFCRYEFPNIQRLVEAMGSNPEIAFILLSPEEPEVVRSWAASQKFKLPFYTVRREDLPEEFTPQGLPTTFIIVPGGRVAFQHSGAAAWDGDKTQQFLRGLAGHIAGSSKQRRD